MHEVSLCRQLTRAVARAAGDKRVDAVYVTVGQLRQVVPEALRHAWVFVVQDTPLTGATLHIDHVPAVVECQDCGAHAQLGQELGFDCRKCGSSHTRVTSGEEFTLTAIDVHDDALSRGPCGSAPTN